MGRDEAIELLKRHEAEARALGVNALYVFGSTARDEARPDSDVDVFVDYDLDRFGLLELARLQRRISTELGRPADVGTRDGLHPVLRETIEAEAVRVF